MERVPMQTLGNGERRAKNDALFGANEFQGNAPSFVTAKTAAYTIKAAEIGCAFSNEGAAGEVAFTLPTPYAGARLHFFKLANQTFTLTPAANTTINGLSDLQNTASESGTAAVTLVGISATKWVAHPKTGTWA